MDITLGRWVYLANCLRICKFELKYHARLAHKIEGRRSWVTGCPLATDTKKSTVYNLLNAGVLEYARKTVIIVL